VSAILEVSGLRVDFPGEGGRTPVVDGVDLEVGEGEVLALVGESGCGKSMTALSVLRLVPRPGRIADGSIRVEGREVRDLPIAEMRALRGREVSMIFQEPMTSLNPVTSAGDQVIEAIRLHEKLSRREGRERAAALFREVGIPDPEARLDAFPHQLSGGLKQRVMIAMALGTRPRLLIADEPTTALDVTIQAQILSLLRDLQAERGLSILLITHDLGVVNELADRVAVMYAGRIVEEGTRSEVLGAAAHPYTLGLLRSMPSLAEHGERLDEIPGVVPAPHELPAGCAFASRCPQVFERCSADRPGWFAVAPSHRLRCHAVAEEAGRGEEVRS
jgi:oligopeptide/dipeptide ABC transporter ATP-binding protein